MVELATTGSDVVTVLRAAASQLLPVVLEMGPDQARYGAFVSSVEGEAGEVYAVLEPVAAEALPKRSAPFRIVPADGVEDWTIGALEITPEGASRARVSLARARLLPREERDEAVALQVTDLLVLVVPGGLHGGDSYVFPIQRIGAQSCEIRASEALAPRERIDLVEVVGDRRLLRRASAEVLESMPWYLPDGSRSFRCRMSLDDESAPSGREPLPHDLVTEPKDVSRLLQLAGMLRGEGWYEAPGWGRGTLRLLEVGRDSMLVELALGSTKENGRGRSIRIGFELFAVAYELDVRVLEHDGGRLRLSLPLILRRRRRHRREHRVAVGPSQCVTLSFRNPVTGAAHTQKVVELSFFAVSFECDPHQNVLWSGLPLEQAQLNWGTRLIHLGDLVVDEHGYDHEAKAARCVATIQQSSVADDEDMIALMATLAHPGVRVHDGSNFPSLHEMYLEAGLFGPHMHRNLAPIVEQTQEVWRRLHSDASEVARTFVRGPANAPDAAATVLRAWEHAWMPQHYVDLRPEIDGATGELQIAYLDHLMPRRDGRYLVFFVKADNHAMNAYLKRFFRSTGTPDAVTKSMIELWSRAPNARAGSEPGGGFVLRDCRPEDEVVVMRAVERALGPTAAAALSIIPGEIRLPDCRQRYARAALERSRECWLVTQGDAIVYAVLEERATPGINLTWILNATWILPVHPESDPDGGALDAALQFVVQRPAQSATGERFLTLPPGLDPERLAAWGFAKEASVFCYVLSRAGLHRVLNFAIHRHGEVDAMIASRGRRRELHASRE